MKQEFNLSGNPLVHPPQLPHGAPALDLIRTEHFEPAFLWALEKARADYAAVRGNPDTPTFENTIEALEFAGEDLGRIGSVFGVFSGSNSSRELREVEERLNPLLTKLSNEITFDAALFDRVRHVYDMREKLALTPEQATLLDKAYKGFARNGALLPQPQKDRLAGINEELSALGSKFDENEMESTAAFQKIIENEDELAGVPQRAKDFYKKQAEKAGLPGKWLIRLSPPPVEILANARNSALRREIWTAMNNIANAAPHDNNPLVLQIMRLRHEEAQILGYPNYAEYVLSNRMAGNAKTVMDFLHKNLTAYKPVAEAELKELRAFAYGKEMCAEIKPWDVAYYQKLLKEEKFRADMEALRPYFEINRVLEGMFLHAEKLFDIKMKPADGKYPVYHPDMKVFEVHDNKTGRLAGVFYADYFARPGAKQNGAWMTSFRKRGLENGQDAVPLVLNVCNYPEPAPGKPTLLSLNDVTTLFHEFGHGLHGLLAEGRYPSLTGTSVKRDFVELPSQLMENWVTEKEVLDTFAVHYETGEKIPASMLEKIQQFESFGNGSAGLRQTGLALLDMGWHTADPHAISNVAAFERKVTAAATLLPPDPAGGPMTTHFGHIFGGYAAGYYSYKWAEVLEADIFERFRKKGLYHQPTAKALRANIYAKGGTEPEMKLFRDMMGRDPDQGALFRREGIAVSRKSLAARFCEAACGLVKRGTSRPALPPPRP